MGRSDIDASFWFCGPEPAGICNICIMHFTIFEEKFCFNNLATINWLQFVSMSYCHNSYLSQYLIFTFPSSLSFFSFSRFIRDNLLTMATLCGAIAGVALGLSLKSMGDGIYTPRQARYIIKDKTKIDFFNIWGIPFQLRGLPREVVPEHVEVPDHPSCRPKPHCLHRIPRLQNVWKGSLIQFSTLFCSHKNERCIRSIW